MTAIVKTVRAASNARTIALASVAAISMSEALTRQQVVQACAKALGKTPSVNEIEAVRIEYIIGKVAMKMKGKDSDARLQRARIICTQYASAPVAGQAVRKLRAGQLGRRSPDEQKAFNAARSAFSLVLAETGVGEAKTIAEKNATQKVAAGRPKGKGAGKSTAKRVPKDIASAMVAMTTSPAKMTRDMATQHIATQAAALLAFCNKHAAMVPLSFSEPVNAFKTAINKAMNAEQERNAASLASD